MWRASPLVFISPNAPNVSARDTNGFAQCNCSRSPSVNRKRAKLSFTERSSSLGVELAPHTLSGHKHLLAVDAGGSNPLPDLALVFVELSGVNVSIAHSERVFDEARTDSTAQLASAKTDHWNAGVMSFDNVHDNPPGWTSPRG
jgi:hypothetical protein